MVEHIWLFIIFPEGTPSKTEYTIYPLPNLSYPSSYTGTAHPHFPTDKSDCRSPTYLPMNLFAMPIPSGTSDTADTMLPDAFY